MKCKGSAITWRSRTQNPVAQSTLEADYISLSYPLLECVWTRNLFGELLGEMVDQPKSIFCDNQGVSCLAENDVLNEQTKHIDVQYHLLTQEVVEKMVSLRDLTTPAATCVLHHNKWLLHHSIYGIVNQLASIGHNVSEMEKKRALIRGLTPDFILTAQVIRSTGKLYRQAITELIIQEPRMERSCRQKVLVMRKTYENNQDCTHCCRTGHNATKCWHNCKGDTYRGGGLSKNTKNGNETRPFRQDEYQSQDSHSEEMAMIMLPEALIMRGKDPRSTKWMPDTACTAHMCNDR